MRNVLAVLILGISIALPGAAAFAGGEGERGADSDHLNRLQFPEVVFRPQPTGTGTIAGPGRELSPWAQMRYDNYGSNR